MSKLWNTRVMTLIDGCRITYMQSLSFGYISGYDGDVSLPVREVKTPPHAGKKHKHAVVNVVFASGIVCCEPANHQW
jgi:hypothetical protein